MYHGFHNDIKQHRFIIDNKKWFLRTKFSFAMMLMYHFIYRYKPHAHDFHEWAHDFWMLISYD